MNHCKSLSLKNCLLGVILLLIHPSSILETCTVSLLILLQLISLSLSGRRLSGRELEGKRLRQAWGRVGYFLIFVLFFFFVILTRSVLWLQKGAQGSRGKERCTSVSSWGQRTRPPPSAKHMVSFPGLTAPNASTEAITIKTTTLQCCPVWMGFRDHKGLAQELKLKWPNNNKSLDTGFKKYSECRM